MTLFVLVPLVRFPPRVNGVSERAEDGWLHVFDENGVVAAEISELPPTLGDEASIAVVPGGQALPAELVEGLLVVEETRVELFLVSEKQLF